MNAFPPLEDLDNLTGSRSGNATLSDHEDKMLKWMGVMDQHISSNKTHHKMDTQFANTNISRV